MTKNTFFSHLQVMALFQLAAPLLRWPSFFPSVIDHDESTYIVIADALRAGKMYFVDVIDNKPIGIFLLFAFFQKVLGTSIVMIRVATAVSIGLTAFALFVIQKRIRSSDKAAWASGLIYVFIDRTCRIRLAHLFSRLVLPTGRAVGCATVLHFRTELQICFPPLGGKHSDVCR